MRRTSSTPEMFPMLKRILAVIAGLSVGVAAPAVLGGWMGYPAAEAAPAATTSRYMQTALRSTLYNKGCGQTGS
jgi:hypothetical protein